jgi:hypothetical protein
MNEDDCLKSFADVLKYDIEQISSVMSLINSDGCIGWRELRRRLFDRREVTHWLNELVQRGWVEACEESDGFLTLADPPLRIVEDVEHYWFRLTDDGLNALESWDAPVDFDEE